MLHILSGKGWALLFLITITECLIIITLYKPSNTWTEQCDVIDSPTMISLESTFLYDNFTDILLIMQYISSEQGLSDAIKISHSDFIWV